MREFPTFYRVHSFITVFTVALSLVHIFFQINAIQALLSHLFTPILILPTYLPLGITRGLIPSGFPIKIQQAHLLCPIHAIYHAHFILTKFGHLNNHIHWHAQISSDSCPLQLPFAAWPLLLFCFSMFCDIRPVLSGRLFCIS